VQNGVEITAIGWRMASIAREIGDGQALEAAFSVEWDDYWSNWRLNLKDLRPA
jgi:hypothetical protein